MSERLDPGGGGLTGATGDLTPDESDEAFVPAERREQAGARAQGSVTYHQAMAAPAQLGEVGEPGEEGAPDGPPSRVSGYGSHHGLSPNDPAYRMEIDPRGDRRPSEMPSSENAGGEPRQGVDEITDHEDRF